MALGSLRQRPAAAFRVGGAPGRRRRSARQSDKLLSGPWHPISLLTTPPITFPLTLPSPCPRAAQFFLIFCPRPRPINPLSPSSPRACPLGGMNTYSCVHCRTLRMCMQQLTRVPSWMGRTDVNTKIHSFSAEGWAPRPFGQGRPFLDLAGVLLMR